MERFRQQLSRGEIVTSVDLSNSHLEEFPPELFLVKDTVEFINFGNNELRGLPSNLGEFKVLKTLFFANNKFTQYPSVLKDLSSLFMISFKGNRIDHIPEDALSPTIVWLILTDNLLTELPKSIGNLTKLRKVMLSGNRLQSLPEEIQQCKDIELIRLAANNLQSLPEWLLVLPKLAWLAYSGNPFATCVTENSTKSILSDWSWRSINMGAKLGEGASGTVFQGCIAGQDIALKIYKGAITSDGNAEDEIAITEAIGNHPSFVPMMGRIVDHPENKLGIVLPLLPQGNYNVLGDPPSFQSVTRDVFATERSFSPEFVMQVLRDISLAGVHLHERGIMHGDLYAHNILTTPSGKALLTDFGAASFTKMHSPQLRKLLENIEVRAFGNLIDDMLPKIEGADGALFDKLRRIHSLCVSENVNERPSFKEIANTLVE